MIEFIEQAGGTTLLTGRLTQDSVCQLWPNKADCLPAQTQVLDLSQLDYTDSAGIAFLVILWRLKQQQGQAFTFVAVPKQAQQLVALYDLKSIFG